jgi:hypothetical protein
MVSNIQVDWVVICFHLWSKVCLVCYLWFFLGSVKIFQLFHNPVCAWPDLGLHCRKQVHVHVSVLVLQNANICQGIEGPSWMQKDHSMNPATLWIRNSHMTRPQFEQLAKKPLFPTLSKQNKKWVSCQISSLHFWKISQDVESRAVVFFGGACVWCRMGSYSVHSSLKVLASQTQNCYL